ncbi:SDR family oxidoreductase [Tunicatimonas pelagia]|uniref:SDR family oxidoreductase n=1 Tax=Tunicatimonas pelagia TaxID=931531 RepID=UPI002666D85B|nr:SDR family oxidoreductase [Tunicatimonas pelagia]WKN44506.1 SDR family oxidoreductase [Tunicatimonas pelagia]
MNDKICVITGANSGIGKVTARELAKQGAHVVMLCRNEEKAERAKEGILRVCGHSRVDIVLADLSSTQQIRSAAERINADCSKIDVLINNAGLITSNTRTTTDDGFETTFGVNHLAPFLLTQLLLDKVLASKQGNIINVSSEAHRFASFDLSDLQYEKRKYNGLKAYCSSKLCNILFTRELSQRLPAHVVTNSLHPGAVASNFGGGVPGFFGIVMQLARPFMISEEKGAETSIYLATSEEGFTATGQYFKDKKVVSPNKEASNNYNAKRLWEISEQLLQITFLPQKKAASA